MFRNYLATALRNLVHNRLYAAINVVGLTLGLTAAFLIVIFLRDELSYDKWIPGYARTYAVLMRASTAGGEVSKWNTAVIDMAPQLKIEFPSIEEATRLRIAPGTSLRRNDRDFLETIYWADPNVFRVLPLPAIAGDLATALEQPDGLVLTRRMARKYFGRDNPIGETIELNHATTLHVTAVLEDLPSNTTLPTEIIASGRAASSPISLMEASPARGPGRPINTRAVYTYIRLKSGASIEDLRQGADSFATRRLEDGEPGAMRRQEPVFVPLADLHVTPFGDNPMTPPGNTVRMRSVGAIGLIVIALAALNFVNLMTARANRRAIEVGVRKVSGAQRRHLIRQFIGEAILHVLICVLLAGFLCKLLLPELNSFLQRQISLETIVSWPAFGLLVVAGLTIGVLAGFYPAFVLSAFRPARVLKGAVALESRAGGWVRQGFVTAQFAILVCLMVGAATIYKQTSFAENEGLRLDKDQVILVQTACRTAFKDEVGKLPGVRAEACSALAPLNHYGFTRVPLASGSEVFAALDSVDFGFFELYGLQPLAGRFFSRDYGKDMVAAGHENDQPGIVINESAATKFGFKSARDAVGQSVSFQRFNAAQNGQKTDLAPAEVLGVVSDFQTGPINVPIMPTIFFVDPSAFYTLQIKLKGHDIPETLHAIEQLWSKYTNGFPFASTFLDARIGALYQDVTREGQFLAMLSGVAIFIACLGLFGLAAHTSDKRTKEIGIRKSMGARTLDVLRLSIWQFAKPVLWANLIAWPLAYLIMQRWLDGFVYHVDQSPWMFLGASALALAVAVLTVIGHALLVARAEPVKALRYE